MSHSYFNYKRKKECLQFTDTCQPYINFMIKVFEAQVMQLFCGIKDAGGMVITLGEHHNLQPRAIPANQDSLRTYRQKEAEVFHRKSCRRGARWEAVSDSFP